jgi:hypothetical protein
MKKVKMTPNQKEFQKVKRFVMKRFPGARTAMNSAGNFAVVYGDNAEPVVSPELFISPARTVREAWTQAKYAAWFSNMIRKSNAAFSDEKIYKKLARESGE